MEAADVIVRVADGVRLHVRRWPGETGRVPFLLVHGLSSNARLWDGVAVRLAAAHHPAYAVDLRGHGESERPAAGYDTATAVADLDALATELNLSPAVVVGQSWGGNVAVEFAATHPARVRALGLVDGGWIDLPAQFESWEACERALRPAEIDGVREADVIAFIRRQHPDWHEWAVRATVANFRVDNDGRLFRRLPIPEHLSILRSMWNDPPGRYHPQVHVPTLLLPAMPAAGDTSDQAERKRALVAKAAAVLPDATVREYPGADHDVHAQQPKAIAADLLDLVAKLAPPP
jgi:pimeloyl-ACP methyl ester carboxylesterase